VGSDAGHGDSLTIEITDQALVAMLRRAAEQRRVSPQEMVEILIRVHATTIDTIHSRKQGYTC